MTAPVEEQLRERVDELERQAAEGTAAMRRLAAQLTLAEQRERRRIASDLHDHVGQALAYIRLRVRDFQGNAVFGGFEEALDEILRLLDQTIAYTRELTGDISPPVLYELGLASALDWLAERFTTRRGLTVDLRVEGRAIPVPEDVAVLVFMAARELLTNSQRHSGAAEATMRLRWQAESLTLTVLDRGRGFDAGRRSTGASDGHGLFGIRERLGDLGGEIDIESRIGGGCRVDLRVPVSARDAP